MTKSNQEYRAAYNTMRGAPHRGRTLEIRYDEVGPLHLLAHASGYCMVRRNGCWPVVMTETQWMNLKRPDTIAKAARRNLEP